MQDRIAMMMIIRSLHDITNELKAMRQEVRQLSPSHPHGGSDFRHELSDESEMDDDAFETPAQRKERGR